MTQRAFGALRSGQTIGAVLAVRRPRSTNRTLEHFLAQENTI